MTKPSLTRERDPSSSVEKQPWKVLLVDDDPEMVTANNKSLCQIMFEGRSLEVLEVPSVSPAQEQLALDEGIAMVMIHVARVGEDGVLKLVHHIRKTLHRPMVRILLHAVPSDIRVADSWLIDHDISGWMEQRALHGQPWLVSVLTALRCYGCMQALASHRHRLHQANAELERLAHVDHHTGCLTRRTFQTQVEQEIARAIRYGSSLALLYIVFDQLNAVYERLDHPRGDAALRQLGETMRDLFRFTDVVGRIGGDLFVALLPGIDQQEAVMVAERLRQSVKTLTVEGAEICFSIDIGISEIAEGDTVDQLIVRAEEAMCTDKNGGQDSGLEWL